MKNKKRKYNLTFNLFSLCITIIILIIFLFYKNEDINIDIWNIFNKETNLAIYLIFVNLITFITFAIDKFKSIKKTWRIKESTLINLCIIGGSIGGLLSMYLFRHKTKHSCFYIGIPLIIITQFIILIYVINII